MRTLVCCVEEASAKEMLIHVFSKLGFSNDRYQFIVFEGKQDLDKKLVTRLKAWRDPNAVFLVLRDQDSADCRAVKQSLISLCQNTEKTFIVRIACHELESFYLGDLAAVEQGLGLAKLSRQQNKKKFSNPDRLSNASQLLKDLTNGKYQKILGSRAISQHLDVGNNKSHSFNVLVKGIIQILDHSDG